MESIQSYSVHWLSNVEMLLANKFYREHGFRGKAKRHEYCAVVRDERRAIAACGYVRDYKEFRLLAGVAVDPAHQGRGVARLLLETLSESFDIHTYTFPYTHLMTFYTSLGFKPCEVEVEVDEADLAEGGAPSSVSNLYQGYRDQGRDIRMMVYVEAHTSKLS